MSETKDIRNHIHLYIGCEVFGTYNDGSGSKGYLTGITNGGSECEIQFILEDGINVEEEPQFNTIEEVKPILRRLSSMTEEEKNHWNKLKRYNPVNSEITLFQEHNEEQFLYLLKEGFDLFNLIDDKLAIDADTLKT